MRFEMRDKSADELVEMGIAPVARDHWAAEPPVVALPFRDDGRAPATAAPEHLSKRQRKKARKERVAAAVCFAWSRGECEHGDGCRFSHDLDAFVAARRPDMPGRCPFAEQPECPYGLLCRWALSHAQPNSLTQALLERKAATAAVAAQPSQPEQPPAAEPAAAPTSGSVAVPEPADGTAGADPAAQQQADADAAAVGDGSIPAAQLELPVLPREGPETNVLDKEVQFKLRRRGYDFSAADRLVEAVGAKPTAASGPKEQQPAAAPEPAIAAAAESAPAADAPANGSNPPANGQATSAAAAASAAPLAEAVAAPAEPAAEPATEPAEPAAEAGITTRPAATAAAEAADNGSARLFDVRRQQQERATADVPTPLRPREKKRLDLSGKLYLAPLTTVGNLPFRRVCKGLGADVTCGEMALATCLLQGQASEWALLKRHPCEDFFGVQVCGSHANAMVRCAQLLEEQVSVDFVDVNMGCPIDLICSKGAGSALMQKPQRMEQIVRGMSAALSCPLTIKVRRGWADAGDVAHLILPKAAAWGAATATLHGRSREQRYTKLANWEYIGRCARAAAPDLPLVGNGDVFSHRDYVSRLTECPQLATTMLARGALIKPWLFTEIKEARDWDISAGERLDLLRQFCSAGLLHWGSDEKGVETTRRFLLEWLSFLCRYVPVGLLERVPQQLHWRPPAFVGRSDLETLLGSQRSEDWVAVSELLLGPPPPGFAFQPKHKSNAYAQSEGGLALAGGEGQENG